jgi:hypothetical protein
MKRRSILLGSLIVVLMVLFLAFSSAQAALVELPVVAATASSQQYPAMNAFDGNYTNFWHVTQLDSVFPKWLQADLGSNQAITRVVTNTGPYPGNIATDFEIWVSDDPTFATHTVAAHITSNTLSSVAIDLDPFVTGRYLRYVVNAVVTAGDGNGWWSACMYELDIFTDDTIPTPTPAPTPTPSLPIVAAVASSVYSIDDTNGNFPMRAFDNNPATYWGPSNTNSGYSDYWLQADLGAIKAVDEVVLSFSSDPNTIPSSFQLWIGEDPTFAPGTYTIAASVTGNSQVDVTLDVTPAIQGRWVRYLAITIPVPTWSNYRVQEMRIYGSDVAPTETHYTVSAATASSVNDSILTAAINAFDSRFNNFWHVNSTDVFPKWVQADLGSDMNVTRVLTFNYGGYAIFEEGNKVVNFQVWIGYDPSFAAGTYTVAVNVTGNDSWITQNSFTAVPGRYVRYVVSAVKGTDPTHFWNANLYEMEIWGTGQAPQVNHAPVAQNQTVFVQQNTATAITLAATDQDNDPLTYSVVGIPTHGSLSGTPPALTYTPTNGYTGPDSFTFRANDSLLNSNTATVSITILGPIPPLLNDISLQNLSDVATTLVQSYGPRHANFSSPYVDDICSLSPTIIYPQSNVEMASNYARSLYESWGYSVTMETVALGGGTWTGHNVVATKVGTVYPNVYIEIGGHLDTQPSTPGAGDNASGSTAILELARVLRNTPTRYSIRFINFVGHEHGGFNEGSTLHLNQALARGEVIKAGLIMDGIGWSEAAPTNMNVLWFNNSSSERIADLFNIVRSLYGIDIGWRKTSSSYSDNQTYWNMGLTSVLSIGGTPYNAPGYHGNSSGCADTIDKLDFQNIYKTAKQNLAVLLLLDAESEGGTAPPNSLPVVASVASSVNGVDDTNGNYPHRAFDNLGNTFWQPSSNNFGFSTRWLEADLGGPKAVDQVYLNFGSNPNSVATAFQIWVGNDPAFADGSYIIAVNVTGNTQSELTLPLSPAVNGRWMRLVIGSIVGTAWSDYQVTAMNIYGTNLTESETKLTVSGATASSFDDPLRTDPIHAFNGQYNDFWHVNGTDTFPKWVQADLGSIKTILRLVRYNYGGYSFTEEGNKARDFQVWVGDDPTFAPGSYSVAVSVTGNDSWITQHRFNPVSGRYVRYVVTAVKGTIPGNYWNTNLYEMELWSQVSGPPPLPASFFGEIHFNEEIPAAGATIEAWVNSMSLPAATTTVHAGSPPYYSSFDVPADDPGTPQIEGGVEGGLVTFKLGGRSIANAPWHSGTHTQVDLNSFALHLQPGWNLVSFNLHPADTAPAAVLSSITGSYDLVYAWNAASQTWLSYDNIEATTDTLHAIDEMTGFWIHIPTVSPVLYVTGSIPTTTSIPLSPTGSGWNLVGFPSASGKALPEVLRDHGVGTAYNLVYAYHAGDADLWKMFDRTAPAWVNDLSGLAPGWGYWVQVTSSVTWSVPYP